MTDPTANADANNTDQLSLLGERKVFIALNPTAGARDSKTQVEKLRNALKSLGFHVEMLTDRVALASAANEAHRHGELRAVVAAGGDGTIGDLVRRTEPGVPVAVLPLGTENLLARYLRLPREPVEVAQLIAKGRTVELDAGLANGRLFLLMVSCGFDAEVVRRLGECRRGHITHLSWIKPIWDVIRRYRYPELSVTYRLNRPGDTVSIENTFDARWAFVSNLPIYAGNLCFSPRATGSDGLLDICAFRQGTVWAGLRYLAGVALRQHVRMSDCISAEATQVVIESDEPVPYQLDGDPGGYLPLSIEVLPRRMTVFASEKWLAAQTSSGAKYTSSVVSVR